MHGTRRPWRGPPRPTATETTERVGCQRVGSSLEGARRRETPGLPRKGPFPTAPVVRRCRLPAGTRGRRREEVRHGHAHLVVLGRVAHRDDAVAIVLVSA